MPSYANAVRSKYLYKPFRCRDASSDSNALVQDVVEALSQVLAGLPYVIEAKTRILDSDSDKREVDVLVRDRKSSTIYAIIECKNISSDEPATYQAQLDRAYRHLSAFDDDRALLKFCIVRKKTKTGRRIDNGFKRISVVLYDWSDQLDWMKMAISIRTTILAWIGEAEDIETYYKLLSYYDGHLDGSKKQSGDYANFLVNIGYKSGQARAAAYKFQHKD